MGLNTNMEDRPAGSLYDPALGEIVQQKIIAQSKFLCGRNRVLYRCSHCGEYFKDVLFEDPEVPIGEVFEQEISAVGDCCIDSPTYYDNSDGGDYYD